MNSIVDSFIFNRHENTQTIETYESKLKKKEIFTMSFATADLQGNLFKLFEGGKIQLNNADINGKPYDPNRRAAMLTRSFPVVVKSIDKESKIVYVSHYIAKTLVRKEIEPLIQEGIKNNKPVRVTAFITKLRGEKNHGHAIINLGGVDILGVVNLGEWSVSYTADIRTVANIGDVIEVLVIGTQSWNGKTVYRCSRRLALDMNPWENIEEKLPQGTVVNVKCISLREKNFFGSIDGIPEINAYCEYPDNRDLRIIEGMSYQGYVAKVNEDSKLLRVKVFKKL